MFKEPKYHKSWKGQLLKAIIIDKITSWTDLQKATGLSESNLNTALHELQKSEIIVQFSKYNYRVIKPDFVLEYKIYYKQIKKQDTKTKFAISNIRDKKHAKIVEYVLKKPLIAENANNEIEYRLDYYKSGRFIDVIKWINKNDILHIGIFEIKPTIDDLGNTVRQIKDYKHQISQSKDPNFVKLPNKHLTLYLVIEGNKRNFDIFQEFSQHFKKSGLDYLMFVDTERNEDMIIPAQRFVLSHINKLSKWIKQ